MNDNWESKRNLAIGKGKKSRTFWSILSEIVSKVWKTFMNLRPNSDDAFDMWIEEER